MDSNVGDICLLQLTCNSNVQAYQVLSEVGEGTYGVVLKCVHRQSGRIVAVKKFKETEEDDQVSLQLCA